MDFEEFAAIYNEYVTQRDTEYKTDWERTRILAYISIQPHIDQKKAGAMTPEKLLPFPWDKDKNKHDEGDVPKLTPEQQRKRMKELVEKLGDELI